MIQRGPVHDKNKRAPNDSGAGPNADAIEEDRGTLAIPEVDLDEVQPYPHLQREFAIGNLLFRIHSVIRMILVDRPCAIRV